jgi:hypothetical protein
MTISCFIVRTPVGFIGQAFVDGSVDGSAEKPAKKQRQA